MTFSLALAKLWQKSIDQSAVAEQPLSVEITNSLNSHEPTTSTPIRRPPANHRWTRKLSTSMFLEIETDPEDGKALSLRIINDDDDERAGKRESSQFSLENDDSLPSFVPSASATTRHEPSIPFGASASDSGVSSNLQSPTVSMNSDQTDSNDGKEQGGALKQPEATHRALYKFCARHADEINLEIGDAIHVFQEYDDQWCEGVNLRTGTRGIFPTSLATDVEYSEFTFESSNLNTSLFGQRRQSNDQHLPLVNFRIKRERYLLDFLGSIEVSEPKGEEVLNEAISRVSSSAKVSPNLVPPSPCILEISDVGLRMMDDRTQSRPPQASQPVVNERKSRVDYFFSLLQITYCGYLLKGEQYFFAFFTRHPSDKGRFACHVFRAPENTRDVAEAVGRAFHRFYNRYVEVSLPLETFYLDD